MPTCPYLLPLPPLPVAGPPGALSRAKSAMPVHGPARRPPCARRPGSLRVEALTDRTVPSGNPTAVNDAYSISPDTALTVAPMGVLANDTNPDGFALSVILKQGPANGTLTLNTDGSFTYIPNPGFAGTDEFRYRASSANGESNDGHVFILVGVTNDPPTAAADQYGTAEGKDVSVAAPGVLANDADVDGDPLAAILVSGPAHGTLTLRADGSFRYIPDTAFVGTDTFTYIAQDSLGAPSAPATVTITVARVNHRPTAKDDRYSTPQDTALSVGPAGVLANDTDPDGDRLSAVLVAGPTHGTLTLLVNGSFRYIPDAGFTGTDSFTYRASDGSLTSGTVRVTIKVVPAGPKTAPDPPPVPPPSGGGTGSTNSGPGGAPKPVGVGATTVPGMTPLLPAPPTLTGWPAAFGGPGPVLYVTAAPAAPAPVMPIAPTPSVVVPTLPAPPSVPFVPLPAKVGTPPPPVVVAPLPAEPDVPVVPPVPQLDPDNPVFGGLDDLTHEVGRGRGVTAVTGTVVGTGVVATAGYVLLSPRLAYWFLSALLARRTVWRPLDPLEVVYAWEREKGVGDGDDESLEMLVDAGPDKPKA